MKLLLVCFMFYLANASATIEFSAGDDKKTSETEIAQNRACFDELARNGCDDPGENLREFRRCLHNVFPDLSADCQKMTSELYRRRN